MSSVKNKIYPDINARLAMIQDDVFQIKQKEMAEICEVSQSHLANMRSGLKEVSASVIRNLCFKKDISPTYLVSGALPIKLNRKSRSINDEVNFLRTELEMLKAELNKNKP